MTRFTTLDAVVLIAYLAGTTTLGLYVGRKQRDAKDYFVADRAIPWWAVMFSIVASETSALTFISTPGLSYGNKPGVGDLGFLQVVAVYISGGIAAIVIVGRLMPGGWYEIWGSAAAANKTRVLDFYPGFDRPHTVFAGLIGGAFLAMASHGTDQLIVQRLMSSRSLKDAQRAIVGSGFVVFCQFFLFLMIGLGLWAFYHGRLFPATDQIFPTFILEYMPNGLVGLIVAAIVAATMSTHSGAINSLAGATTHDIYLPLTGRSADDPQTLPMGPFFPLGWAVVLTLRPLPFPPPPP